MFTAADVTDAYVVASVVTACLILGTEGIMLAVGCSLGSRLIQFLAREFRDNWRGE